MPTSDAIYSPDISTPQELVRERANSVELRLLRHNQLVTPTSGTYSLIKSGNQSVVSAAVVTIADRTARYTVLASALPSTEPLGEGWREEWTMVLPDGRTEVYERDCAIVRKKLHPVISDRDLEVRYTDIATFREDRYGSWQSFIEEAWKVIKMRLLREGHLPYLNRTPSSMREMHVHLTLSLMMMDFHSGLNDGTKWLDLATKHEDAYERAWAAANWKSDYDHDGEADESDGSRDRGPRHVHPNIPPYRRYFSKFV